MDEPHSYELSIPANGRLWISANSRAHWRVRASLTASWRGYTELLAHSAGLPPMNKALVVCELIFPDRRRRDPANWHPTAKACVDGLVDAGVFPDDDHKHVTGPDMRIGLVGTREQRGLLFKIFPEAS